MTPKEFEKYLRRDSGCLHCGFIDVAVPHHRANRGAGGFKGGNKPSNLLVMCARANQLMESDHDWARLARTYGWKISRYDDPSEIPVWYPLEGRWFLLNDEFERQVFTPVDKSVDKSVE